MSMYTKCNYFKEFRESVSLKQDKFKWEIFHSGNPCLPQKTVLRRLTGSYHPVEELPKNGARTV